MRRILIWVAVVIMVISLTLVLGYVGYLKRDKIEVMLGLAEPKPELSATPLFKPLDKFVISLEGGAETHYMVLEVALVTHNPAVLNQLDEQKPLLRNAMVQYFSHRSHDEVRKELQQIKVLQESLLKKLELTLESYGYKTYLDELLITKVVVQ
ncbi:flagellar basal body-associated FliL family protein [Aeromonas schubertii]|uniref:Flagellar protein FliL n=1 Tax=Aeromonas schubertii TaxID=652 RepID=A0ABS7VCG8_9GAMM|nr:flagellar basal body-associated FliL family protein [Aeromonas schubertii]MBZ6067077.1 flagellar basal body-associated FliL family protein [Aeromonas schubertii]MBZ6074127.1 flagellar basal body-associated FliL family protein [Aeromonas schubertii]